MQRDEASVARGHAAQWNVSVWATNSKVSSVKITLAASPSGLKPTFTSGCATEGKNSCSLGSVDSGSQHTTLGAQVPVPASDTSVTSVKLTAKASGKNVSSAAAVPVSVTAAGGAAVGSGHNAAPGTGVLTPAGVRSSLGVGGLPFLSATGARTSLQPSLSPGGNASSLFPTLNPSSSSASGPNGTSRIRSLAESLPGDASLMGAQYAGLFALAVAFVLSVTRFQIRRRQAATGAAPGSQPPAAPTA